MKRFLFFAVAIFSSTSAFGASCYRCSDDRWPHHIAFTADVVYLRRVTQHDRSVAVEDGSTVLTTNDASNKFDFTPGYRGIVQIALGPKNRIEGSYLHLQAWHGTASVSADGNIDFPFDSDGYAVDFLDADRAKEKYSSTYIDAQVNYWRHSVPPKVDYFSVSAIFGARQIYLREKYLLSYFTESVPHVSNGETSDYNIYVRNRLVGGQIGVDFEMNPTDWFSWDLMGKVGCLVDMARQTSFLGDLGDSITLRDFTKQRENNCALVDLAATLTWTPISIFYVHVGYQFLYLSSVALAPPQIDKGVGSGSGDHLFSKSQIMIHGLFGGITIDF